MTKHNYNKPHAWQHEIRLHNLQNDLKEANLTESETKNLKISDFEFAHVDAKDTLACK